MVLCVFSRLRALKHLSTRAVRVQQTMDESRLVFTKLRQDQKGKKQAIVYLQLFYTKSNTIRVNISTYT